MLTAGFFFGPTAGLVAGLIAAVERALTPLWGVGLGHWQLSASITLLIAGYGAALSKWIFDGKRPPVVAAAGAAANPICSVPKWFTSIISIRIWPI